MAHSEPTLLNQSALDLRTLVVVMLTLTVVLTLTSLMSSAAAPAQPERDPNGVSQVIDGLGADPETNAPVNVPAGSGGGPRPFID